MRVLPAERTTPITAPPLSVHRADTPRTAWPRNGHLAYATPRLRVSTPELARAGMRRRSSPRRLDTSFDWGPMSRFDSPLRDATSISERLGSCTKSPHALRQAIEQLLSLMPFRLAQDVELETSRHVDAAATVPLVFFIRQKCRPEKRLRSDTCQTFTLCNDTPEAECMRIASRETVSDAFRRPSQGHFWWKSPARRITNLLGSIWLRNASATLAGVRARIAFS